MPLRRLFTRRLLIWIAAVSVATVTLLVAATAWMLRPASLTPRITALLSSRLNLETTIDDLAIALWPRPRISGSGLRMRVPGRPDLPPNTLAELLTYIRANGDKMTFGNAGLGAASHLCGMLFMTAVGKEILAVPYKGNAPIMNDLIGKQIDLSCDQTTNTTAPIASKLIKSYAITTKTRLASMPDLPTADEAGLKGFEVGAWHGIYAPKGTPDDIVQKLSKTLQEALRDPDLVKRFNDINTEPVSQDQATPEALKAQLISEVDRWAPLIKAANQFAD